MNCSGSDIDSEEVSPVAAPAPALSEIPQWSRLWAKCYSSGAPAPHASIVNDINPRPCRGVDTTPPPMSSSGMASEQLGGSR